MSTIGCERKKKENVSEAGNKIIRGRNKINVFEQDIRIQKFFWMKKQTEKNSEPPQESLKYFPEFQRYDYTSPRNIRLSLFV